MKNSVFIEAYSNQISYKETGTLKLPLESFISYCIHKSCSPENVKLYFVPITDEKTSVNISLEDDIEFLEKKEVPWSVAMCIFPVVSYEDTIITGLCAVARHICKFRSSVPFPHEHEEGLLGFRKSCLQAPNEVSIWTKFCEIELPNTVCDTLTCSTFDVISKNMVRFENHLKKPVRVHNVYKIARNIKKDNLQTNNVNNQTETKTENVIVNENRVPKVRKWKSNKKKELEIDCSTKIEDLDVRHLFAEGPFLTLADLILLPLYYIIKNKLGDDVFEKTLPSTHKWFENITSVPELKELLSLLSKLKLSQLEINTLEISETEDFSLYKCDPKRHNPKKRLFTKEDDIINALSTMVDDMELEIIENKLDFGAIQWNEVPDGANPTAGHLPDGRMDRKTQQLENLALAVLSIAKEKDLIVDFCCGSGHLGILLAHLLPKCTIILLENKEQSLLRARNRVHEMGLKNVYFYQCNLDFFIGKFDIGIGLHACGIASDLVLDKCLKANAKFVLCPCCYGSLHATDRLVYPRSQMFGQVPMDQYLCIGHAADQTHEDHPLTVRGARCMAIIDSDRGQLAKEFGYKVTLSRLKPLSCTPKNNLLIGVPA